MAATLKIIANAEWSVLLPTRESNLPGIEICNPGDLEHPTKGRLLTNGTQWRLGRATSTIVLRSICVRDFYDIAKQ